LSALKQIVANTTQLVWSISSWTRWYLKAGNAHGLHSPFVFKLYNEVLMHKAGTKSSLIPRLLSCLGIEAGNNLNRPFLFLILSGVQNPDEAHLIKLLAEEACVMVQDSRVNKGRNSYWQKARRWNVFSISIDMGSYGLLFVRTGVVKQHFVLRP
jgi:hypothetical protein